MVRLESLSKWQKLASLPDLTASTGHTEEES